MKFSKQFWERAVWVWILCFPLAFAGSFSTSIGTAQVNSILASPGPIGSVTPNTGSFSTLASPSVAITGGTITGITGTSSFGGGTIGLGAAGGINGVSFSAPTYNVTTTSGKYQLNSKLLFSATAPTIASGFGTSPSIVYSNGSASFQINVGTGGTATNGSITMPAAPNVWSCMVDYADLPPANQRTWAQSVSTTSVTLSNILVSTSVSQAWAASTVLKVNCVPL